MDATSDSDEAESLYPANWWRHEPDGRIRCELCPRDCRLADGQRGACFVRKRQGEAMYLTTWGRSSGFCIDPIEKKPLSHFYPGSSVLSFGTAGCNLTCKFCQNHDISRSRDQDRLMARATPEAIAAAAKQYGADSVAYTYNDPVIFAEYAIDTAVACRAAGVANVAVTAGYIREAPRRAFFAAMDAANVDLKSFSDGFYHKLCSAALRPVLDTLVYLRHATACWLEVTTLLIPGYNDGEAELLELSRWFASELGPEVPLHFSAFHPDWKMREIARTPAATLFRAREIALGQGLHYVYCGNIDHPETSTTYCPGCAKPVIARRGYDILAYRLDDLGHCVYCQQPLSGRFRPFRTAFGSRRIPVSIAA